MSATGSQGFAALAALPLWWLADDPLWAVMLTTTSDLLGFGPTLRRVWLRPHDERACNGRRRRCCFPSPWASHVWS